MRGDGIFKFRSLFFITIESPLTKISAILQRRQVSTNDSFEARIEPVRRRRVNAIASKAKMPTARGQICESSSFSGEFLPRGRSRGTRVHPSSISYQRSSSMLAPRDRDRAKTTGDRRGGKDRIGFLRPRDSYRRFSWHGSI